MIVILGYYSAALLWARERGFAMRDWMPAVSPPDAVRALYGRDPNDTEIEYVHGSWNVLTPEVKAIITRLKAMKTQPDEVIVTAGTKSEEWVCSDCATVTHWPGSRRWPATWPVTLACKREHTNTPHYRMGTQEATALLKSS